MSAGRRCKLFDNKASLYKSALIPPRMAVKITQDQLVEHLQTPALIQFTHLLINL